MSFFELEKRRAISPSPWTNGNCALFEGYVVQSILFYPQVFRRRILFYPCLFPWNRSRTPQQNQLKISCTSTYFFVFIMSPPLGEGGIQFYRPFVKKQFPCNNIKTPQHNHFRCQTTNSPFRACKVVPFQEKSSFHFAVL